MLGSWQPVSTIDCSSFRLGSRQSLWPAKIAVFAAVAAACAFTQDKLLVLPVAQPAPLRPSLHCFHIRPVVLWVTVESPLSTRSASRVARSILEGQTCTACAGNVPTDKE